MSAVGTQDYEALARAGHFEYREPRRRVYLNGKLVHGDGAFSFDCVIRDLSPGGAKIAVRRTQMMPRDLYLIAVKACLAHHAQVVWTNVPSRGLKFVDTFDLNDNLPENVKFLRPLWESVCVRGAATPD
jgi:hypothetical protein